MSSHQERQQTRILQDVQKHRSRPAEQQGARLLSEQKLETGAEDDADTDPDDLQLEKQHAEFYDSEADDKDQKVSTTPQQAATKDRAKLGKRQRQADSRQPSVKFIQETVYPVHCEICDAQLGVQDADEVVHFFNTFPSTA